MGQQVESQILNSSLRNGHRDDFSVNGINQSASSEVDQIITVENLVMPDGTIYSGQLKKLSLVKHGFGKQIWKDGAKYEGEWREGKANGKGTFYHLNGDVYEGEFVDDRANGYGVYYHKNGSKYTGYWRNDLKDGKGREEWEDGAFYDGEFK